jgi:hypothetical protein
MFKVIGHMGDGLQNILLGLISSILPKQNSIANKISKTSKSNYFFQETFKSCHSMFPKLRIFKISACLKGCCAFIGANVDLEFCPICDRRAGPCTDWPAARGWRARRAAESVTGERRCRPQTEPICLWLPETTKRLSVSQSVAFVISD